MLSGIALSAGSSDFRLLDRVVLKSLEQMRDSGSFLRGLTQWTGYHSTTIEYQAQERRAGKTKYSLFKMSQLAWNAILSFSVIPLKMGIWVGLLTSLLALVEIVYVVNRYLAGATVPGWASLACLISFMFGVLFILVGIIGAYLANIFEILKNRPPYLVEHRAGFDTDD
jgi:dolichol-phosphate mannosyltransferase